MDNNQPIRSFQTDAADPRAAVRAFRDGVQQPDTELVIFFCSSHYDLATLADEMRRQFGAIRVVGCTSAGEFGPQGYLEHTLVGASFAVGSVVAVSGLACDLQHFDLAQGAAFARALLYRLQARVSGADAGNSFGLMLVDGMSIREEQVAFAWQQGVGGVPLIGGSAADDSALRRTQVYHDGAFHSDSAVLLLISTPLPFRLFRTQHFVAGDERLVVTEADTAARVVNEINGLPAAEEYARLIGVPLTELDDYHFARTPLVVRIGGHDYVRSIQRVGEGGSLVFYCAIDQGLVLRLARTVDMEQSLLDSLALVRAALGELQLVIGFDCILRGLEMEQAGSKPRIGEILRSNLAIGFGSYGEQYCGIHMNQTLTGVAIGRGEA